MLVLFCTEIPFLVEHKPDLESGNKENVLTRQIWTPSADVDAKVYCRVFRSCHVA